MDTRLTTEENKDNFVNGNEILTLGNGTANTTPSLRLLGNNSQGVSSRIVFADSASNNPGYYQGMAIFYDSFYNTLHISGDNDSNQIIDTPPAISVMRQNRYVGIQNTNPQYVLDIGGDVNTTGNIKINGANLNDGVYIKNLLEAAGYRVLKNVMLNMNFTYDNFTYYNINQWFKINVLKSSDPININNGGFVFDYTNNRIIIPQTGTYRVSYNMNFTNLSSDRINLTSALYLNGAYLPSTESRGAYGRFNGWQLGMSCCAIVNLTANDYLDFWLLMNRSGASYTFQFNGGASQISIELIS